MVHYVLREMDNTDKLIRLRDLCKTLRISSLVVSSSKLIVFDLESFSSGCAGSEGSCNARFDR